MTDELIDLNLIIFCDGQKYEPTFELLESLDLLDRETENLEYHLTYNKAESSDHSHSNSSHLNNSVKLDFFTFYHCTSLVTLERKG